MLAARLRSHLDSLVADPAFAGVAGRLDAAEIAGSPQAIRALIPQLRDAVVDGLASGVSLVFLLAVPLVVAAVTLVARIDEVPLRTSITTDVGGS